MMKALTLWQPFASLKACGAKEFETRGWATKYRGPVAIHAGAKRPHKQEDMPWEVFNAITEVLAKYYGAWRYDWHLGGTKVNSDGSDNGFDMPLGAVIAVGELIECWSIHGASMPGSSSKDVFIEKSNPADSNGLTWISTQEYMFGNFAPGRYAWEFANVKMLAEPIPARGQQGLWNWEPPEGGLQYADS